MGGQRKESFIQNLGCVSTLRLALLFSLINNCLWGAKNTKGFMLILLSQFLFLFWVNCKKLLQKHIQKKLY